MNIRNHKVVIIGGSSGIGLATAKAVQQEGAKVVIENYEKQVPLKRIGTAEDVADAAVYLMKSTYTTGTTLQVDGGALLIIYTPTLQATRMLQLRGVQG